jgi:hypothetical protein
VQLLCAEHIPAADVFPGVLELLTLMPGLGRLFDHTTDNRPIEQKERKENDIKVF